MKKVLILVGLAAAGYYFFGTTTATAATPATTPTTTAAVGFNADGTVRQLTDTEAQSYLNNNADLQPYFTANLGTANIPAGTVLLDWAKSHWFNFGYKEGRKVA